MINTHLLELPLSRTYFHGSKCVRAIEVVLYVDPGQTSPPYLGLCRSVIQITHHNVRQFTVLSGTMHLVYGQLHFDLYSSCYSKGYRYISKWFLAVQTRVILRDRANFPATHRNG